MRTIVPGCVHHHITLMTINTSRLPGHTELASHWSEVMEYSPVLVYIKYSDSD